jgi:predicted Zn-dependent protease
LKRLSAIFKQFPEVQDSNITFTASRTKRYLTNSEGTNIQDELLQYRIMSTVTTTASDGMKNMAI